MRPFAFTLLAAALLQAQAPSRGVMRRSPGQNAVPPEGELTFYNKMHPPPEYTGPKGSISGTVLDAATNTPVKKAQVRISNSGPQTVAVTDASGSFTFEQLPPGSYTVFANHPAYPPNSGVQMPTTLAPGEQKRGADVKLTPGATVSGHITDEEGDPLANCNVSLFTRSATQNFQPTHRANTNNAGDYAMPALPTGKYYLEARCTAPYLQPRAFAPPEAVPTGPQFSYAPVYYPGTPTFTGAQKIKLMPSQDVHGMDFRMALQKVTTVTIHVATADEERENRLFATLVSSDSPVPNGMNNLAAMVQPRTGLAQIRSVPPGTYTLTINASGPNRATYLRQTIQVAEEPRDIAVQLAPLQPITGVVHIESNAANAATPTATNNKNANRLMLFQTDEGGMQFNTALAEDGTFTFPSLPTGHFRANVTGGGFVQSVSVANEVSEGPDFELKQGATGPLTLNVGFGTGTVSGDVQLSDAHPAQFMLFAVSGSNSHMNSVAVPAGAGSQPVHYSFPLPPGTYHVYALEVVGSMNSAQLILSDALLGRDEKITVKAAAEITRNLKLITAADFEKADQ